MSRVDLIFLIASDGCVILQGDPGMSGEPGERGMRVRIPSFILGSVYMSVWNAEMMLIAY